MSPAYRKSAGHRRALFGRDVHHLFHAPAIARESARRAAEIELHERRCGDRHQVHGNRVRLTPAGERSRRCRRTGAVMAEQRFREQYSVRHHLPFRRRAHVPRDRRLVARVVDGRDPVPRAVRPVVAERHPSARAVGTDDQAVLHFAGVVQATRSVSERTPPTKTRTCSASCVNVAGLPASEARETLRSSRSSTSVSARAAADDGQLRASFDRPSRSRGGRASGRSWRRGTPAAARRGAQRRETLRTRTWTHSGESSTPVSQRRR